MLRDDCESLLVKLKRQLNALRSALKGDSRRGASVVTCALLGLALLIGTDSGAWIYHGSYNWLVRAKSLVQSPPYIEDILIVSCDEETIKVLGEDPIAMNDRAPVILASADRDGDCAGIVAHQPDRRRPRRRAAADRDAPG